MTCRHVLQLRDVYLDGDLSSSLTAEVHAHLLQCPECQDQYEMLRACGDLIAKDQPDAALDSGFASRVVASLAKDPAVPLSSQLPTRRSRRQRYWRMAISSCLPAAAAIVFLSVLIWPTSEPARQDSMVLGVSKPADVVGGNIGSALDAVGQATSDARTLGQMVGLPLNQAIQEVAAAETRREITGPQTPLDAFWEVFFGIPSRELLEPPPTMDGSPPAPDVEEIVRF